MNADWPYPRVIAHRGGGAYAPENTLAAIRRGRHFGFAGVEFDVMLAADAVPMLIHDETLERTTNGKGSVSRTPSDQLAVLDAGRWFGAEFAGEPVPRYADAVRLCRDLGLWANVEIKPAAGLERDTGTIVARLSAELWQGASAAPLLSSFSVAALEAAREAAPQVALGLLMQQIAPAWRETAQRLECVSVHCDHRELSPEQAEQVRSAGYALLCYTVNEPDRARELFAWGVNAIFTDRLDVVRPDL